MLCDGIQVLSSALSVESQIPVCFYSTETVVVFVCVYRIIQFPRPVKFKEVVQKVTDAFGQTMDLVCVNNEVLFSLLLRGSFRVPGANFRIEQWFVLKALILRFTWMQKKNNLILWFPGSEGTRAVVWTQLRWILRLQARFSLLKIISSKACCTGTLSFPQNKRSPSFSRGCEVFPPWGQSQEREVQSRRDSAAHSVFFHPALTLSHPNPSTMCTFLWPSLQ